MTIFLVYREADKKFMGGYVDARAIFELPADTYIVCVAEEGKITNCTTVILNKDTTVKILPKTCEEQGYILPEECPVQPVTRVTAKRKGDVSLTASITTIVSTA